MTRRNLIITLGLIVFVVIAVLFRLTRVEPVPPLKQDPRQAQEPEEKQQAAPPKQEPRQTQVIQQPQDPSEDPGRPQQPQPESSPEELEPHARAVADISALRAKLDDYKSRMGEFPATVEGLRALGVTLPKDRWGHDYIYNSPSVLAIENPMTSFRRVPMASRIHRTMIGANYQSKIFRRIDDASRLSD